MPEAVAEFCRGMVLLIRSHGMDRIRQCCELLLLGVRFGVLLVEDERVSHDEIVARGIHEGEELVELLWDHDDFDGGDGDINTTFTVMKTYIASRLSHEGFHLFTGVNAVRWFIGRAGLTVRVRDAASAAHDREAPWPFLEAEIRRLYSELEGRGLRRDVLMYEEAQIETAWHRPTVQGALPTWRLL